MDADRAAVRIFDLIDANQLTQAEGALETALKKFPQDDSLHVAEALLKMRSGNWALAKKMAVELSTKKITKPKAVNALVHVLQNCCCWEELAATYERLKPLQNERQISENLVQTYARMGAYGKVQQTATQLYRQYNDPKYQVWMVQGMLAQVPADSTDHMLLKLATKLLDAAVLTEKGHVVPPTVQTYVDVLAQQGQYSTAVDFLMSERAAKIGLLATRLEQLSTMLRKVGRVTAANAVARHLWTAESDNWTSFVLYKDSLQPAAAEKEKGEHDVVLEVRGPVPEMRATIDCSTAHHSLEEAVQLAHELQALEESQHPKKVRRGPFLAELDLLNTLEASEELHTKVMAYVKRFYRKPSCYLDISTFLTPAIAAEIYAWSRDSTDDGAALADELDAHTRRVLGLRCYVASWEKTPAAAAEMHTLFDSCVEAYHGSRKLSEGLAWSEEGYFDGYITVALNIALRGYAATAGEPNFAYLVKGLNALQGVDRRMNNPTWLIFSVCFANLLGLTDCAALHQLAFKNVQRDTMAHIGYWPLLSGLALDDVAEWEGWAEDHFSRQERDCSLLRAKVFNYTSWPAMQDVQRFEAAQMNSLYRWQYPANEFVAVLTECQTVKDVVESFDTRSEELWAAWERLRTGSATLLDNTDWVVARSMILGNIHSAQVQQLTEALVAVPAREWQVRRSRQILASALLLHDLVAVHVHQQTAASRQSASGRKGGKGKAGNTNSNNAGEHNDAAPLELYTVRMEAQAANGADTVEYLPAIAPLARVLRPYIDARGEASPEVPEDALQEFRDYLQSCVTEAAQPHSAAAFENFLYPQAYVLAALLKLAPAKRLPVKQWATAAKEALEVAQQRYETASWSTLAHHAGQDGETPLEALAQLSLDADSFVAKLMEEKVRRIVKYVSSLKVELSVYTR